MEEKVIDHPDLLKVNKSYIINTNEKQYQAALARRQRNEKIAELDTRLTALEYDIKTIIQNDIKTILTILQR